MIKRNKSYKNHFLTSSQADSENVFNRIKPYGATLSRIEDSLSRKTMAKYFFERGVCRHWTIATGTTTTRIESINLANYLPTFMGKFKLQRLSFGLAWLGLVLAWLGLAWLGLAWLGLAC